MTNHPAYLDLVANATERERELIVRAYRLGVVHGRESMRPRVLALQDAAKALATHIAELSADMPIPYKVV